MKIVINNHSNKVYKLTNEVLIKAIASHDNNFVELENGVWLQDMLDGRYYATEGDAPYAIAFEVSDSYNIEDPASYSGEEKELGFVAV